MKESYLIVGGITVLHTKIEIFEIDINIWQNHTLPNLLPNNARHFITVHFNNWIGNLFAGQN